LVQCVSTYIHTYILKWMGVCSFVVIISIGLLEGRPAKKAKAKAVKRTQETNSIDAVLPAIELN
jgi:hypothetical protein